jgi:hypothetical protein
MKIGLVTTLGTNIGDDFIREGLCGLFRACLPDREIEFVCINKHKPYSAYPVWHPVRIAAHTKNLPQAKYWSRERIFRSAGMWGGSLVDDSDLIVQCGTPVAWPSCHDSEWAEPLWKHTLGRLSRQGIPVINIGAGSCYPWERQPLCIQDTADSRYLKEILSYCQITTVRDRLLKDLFLKLGHDCPFIPCPALLAGQLFSAPVDESADTFVINYMEGAGHYAWGQKIDSGLWRSTVQNIMQKMKNKHPIMFLCHDEKEFRSAQELAPEVPRVLPRSPGEYFEVLKKARFGLCNRLHASMAFAGLGIPSIAVGTDTRLLMVEAIGLPSLYVNDATEDCLESIIVRLSERVTMERGRLLALRDEVWGNYTKLLKPVLAPLA